MSFWFVLKGNVMKSTKPAMTDQRKQQMLKWMLILYIANKLFKKKINSVRTLRLQNGLNIDLRQFFLLSALYEVIGRRYP